MQQYKVVKVDVSPEEAYNKQKKQNRLLILFILLLILGFFVYEWKFAEKSIFNKGDKYEEYDPNYTVQDDSNAHQEEKTSNTSNTPAINSNVTPSNVTPSNTTPSNTTPSNITPSNSNKASNQVSNKPKDTTKPVISSISFTNVTDKSVKVNAIVTDNASGTAKIKIEYSVNNKNWQTSNTFSKLNSNTTYTVYIRATDEAGNVSSTFTKSVKTHTTVSSIPNGVYGNYKVYSVSSNEIVVYDKGWKYAKLSSSNTWYRTYKSSNATYNYMDSKFNNQTYKSSISQSDIIKELYDTTVVSFKQNTLCNGHFKGSRGNLYFFDINVNGCRIYFDIDYGKLWHAGGHYIEGDDYFTLGYGNQGGTAFSFRADFKNNNNTVEVTNGKDRLLESEKNSVINNSEGTYNKVKALTANDVIKLKVKGDLN